MIKSFRCRDTQRLFAGQCPQAFRAFQYQAERKLALPDAARTLGFLASPPGNRLELLRGNRSDCWSIRINRQWRICFRFENGNAYDVEILDYH